MARDGSGVMSVPYPSFQSGTAISSTQVNSNNSDITYEITNSLPRDGQAAPTANIPFGTYKITGLGAGAAATDSANLGQVQAQAYIWGGTAGGTKNALTLTPSPAITAYAAGQTFRFIAGGTASDDAVTLAISGLATKAVQSDNAALSATVYIEASKVYEATYDGTQFQIKKVALIPLPATQAQAEAGTNTDTLMTPLTTAQAIAAQAAYFSTGDVKLTLKTTADTGWIMCNDGTIGDASSGGTTRANADTEDLFTLLWTNVSDTYAPVSSGRGASAAADFAAHKTIGLTKMLGRALGLAGSGATLTARALGQTVGAETHVLQLTEMAAHTHYIQAGSGTWISTGGGTAGPGGAATNSGSAGSGGSHNNMQPTSFLNAMIKL